MYLRLIGNSFTENVFKEIEAITNHGTVKFRQIRYEKEKGLVHIPITRMGIERKRRRWFGRTSSYKYNKETSRPSLVTVGSVTDFELETAVDDTNIDVITMLFGVTIRDRELFISSVEEWRGKLDFSLKLKLDKIDIEIRDEDDETNGRTG